MSYILTALTGSAVISGQRVDLKNKGSAGAVIVYNNSQVAFNIDDTQGNTHFLPNGFADIYAIGQGTSSILLTPEFTVASSGNNPNTVSFEVLTLTDLTKFGRTFPVALGAASGVASVSSIINDGNPAGTQIVEATPSGAPGSDVLITNDGVATFAGVLTAKSLIITGRSSFGGVNAAITDVGSGTGVELWTGQSAGLQAINFITWTGAAMAIPFAVGGNPEAAKSFITSGGAVGQLAGQAAVGSFGIPVIVAEALNVNVTSTGTQTILDYIPSVSGSYRISANAVVAGTGAGNITFFASWTDPNGPVPNVNFWANNSGTTNWIDLNGTSVTPTVTLSCAPILAHAAAANDITITYNRSAGSPADFITVIIERLA